MKIKDTLVVVSCYGEPNLDWLKEYTDNVIAIDKNENNVGYNIFTYMDWIVKNYDNLPDTVMFIKNNLLERHITKEEFDKICNNKTLTPLLTQNHKVDFKVNYYEDGLYYEVNNYWYRFHYTVQYLALFEGLKHALGIIDKSHLGFAPGGCWIVPKANILKRSKTFYEILRSAVGYTQLPAEAHLIERSLFYIWS